MTDGTMHEGYLSNEGIFVPTRRTEMSDDFPRIAEDGDRMDGPSEATETNRLEELAEELEGKLIVAQAKLGRLKGSYVKAIDAVDQVDYLLNITETALKILLPLLQTQLISVGQDAGRKVIAETNLASFLNLLKGVSDEQINIGRLTSLVALVEKGVS